MPQTPFIGPWPVLALVAITLLPFGSVAEDLRSSIVVLTAIVLAAVLARWQLGRAAAPWLPQTRLQAALLFGLPLLAALHYVLQTTVGLSTGADYAILRGFITLVLPLMVFVMARAAAEQKHGLMILAGGLFAIGTAEAAYGVLNFLAGNTRLLIWPRWAYHDSVTGTLVNRGHFAYLMELCIPLGAACTVLLGTSRRAAADDSDVAPKRILLWSAVVLMGLALVLSRSRMGIASLAGALILVHTLDHYLRPATQRRSRSSSGSGARWAAPLVGVAVLALAMVVGLDPILDRFLQAPRHLEAGRLPIWRAGMAMVADQPLLGHGWGTFAGLFDAYRPAPTGLTYHHAHNEYLQVAIEAGIPGLLLVGGLVVTFARRLTALLASPLRSRHRRLVVGLGVGMVAVLLHSITDFGLRTPGIAITFAVACAMFAAIPGPGRD